MDILITISFLVFALGIILLLASERLEKNHYANTQAFIRDEIDVDPGYKLFLKRLNIIGVSLFAAGFISMSILLFIVPNL
jgi:hypothetical protein